MAKLSPHLRFDDKKTREALNFYKDCFGGGEMTFQISAETPMAKDMSADMQDSIMHATFKHGEIEFTASDMMRDKAVIGDNVVMALNCNSEEELRNIFSKLEKGGSVFMAPEKAFWGAIFGMVTDKYGVEWMLNFQIEK